jgi:hypothetical protein
MTGGTPLDPFREAVPSPHVRRLQLLGARVRFAADDRRLLRLVDAAFGRLPRLRLQGPPVHLDVQLRLQPAVHRARGAIPAAPHYSSGAGWLSAIMDASNYVIVEPRARRALVSVSAELLRPAYLARYELLEFAVLTLAARAQGLVALHGACVARGDRAVLLLGERGAGKSTLCVHGLQQGLALLSEDSVFVAPATREAVGLANFLHLRAPALSSLPARLVGRVRAAPVIQRRSGVEKFELDVRRTALPLVSHTPRIAAVVFVRDRAGRNRPRLAPLDPRKCISRLRADQPYAAGQPGWRRFVSSVRGRGFELTRGADPRAAVLELGRLLSGT